jgi:FkbM family methyltransferase
MARRALKKLARHVAYRLGYDLTKRSRQLTVESHLARLLDVLGIDLLLDVGANDGSYGRLLRDVLGYRGEIHSFEPAPEPYARLASAAAGDAAWFTHNVALGDHDGSVELHVAARSVLSSLHPTSAFGRSAFAGRIDTTQTLQVPMRRLDGMLDSHVADFARRRVFLKMDTQGHDQWVFAGAGAYAGAFHGLQSELSMLGLYDGVADYADMLKLYRDAGYEPTGFFTVSRDDASLRLVEIDCLFSGRRARP